MLYYSQVYFHTVVSLCGCADKEDGRRDYIALQFVVYVLVMTPSLNCITFFYHFALVGRTVVGSGQQAVGLVEHKEIRTSILR